MVAGSLRNKAEESMRSPVTTAPTATPSAAVKSAIGAPPARRRWSLALACMLVVPCLLYGIALYGYLQHGWFESTRLGQTLQLRRIYQEGLHYRARPALGLFPKAQGLLDEPFTQNAWQITSADGHTLYHKPATWWVVSLSHIPPAVRQPFLVREDQRFYQHAGVDLCAILRAVFKTLTGREQGGSTIAMQVAKHCLLGYGETPASSGLRGIVRKVREMLLAWRLVKVEGREKVLAFYLNHAAMGPGIHGLGPAAWDYFRKTPQQLSLGEVALLAVVLPSPSHDPRQPTYASHYEVARKALLRRMYDAASISRRTYHSALPRPQLHAPAAYEAQLAAPQSVAAAFRAINPVLQGLGLPYSPQQLRQQQPFPLQVRVSLHAQLSWRLYAALAPTLATLDLRYAAIIVVDGAPVVLLGGDLDLLHYAFHAKRQVGSVSKLFFYESVWHLGYVRPDEIVPDGDLPETLRQRLGRPPYHPRNDDGQIRQRLPHHQSLSQSIHKMAYLTTWGARTDAQRLAIARRLVQQFALPWQHASRRGLSHFYRTFTTDESVALGTWHATPFDVAAMLEQGFRGHTLRRDQLILAWQNTPLKHSRATTGIGLSPQLFRALRGAVAHTAPQAVLHNTPWTLTAKTGTTDGGRDARLAGFIVPNQEVTQATIHPRITFVAWAGSDDGRPAGWYGGSVHGPVFGRFLQDWRVQAMLLALLGQAR